MMQVSSLYAQSIERQLVSRSQQLLTNLSRSSCLSELERLSASEEALQHIVDVSSAGSSPSSSVESVQPRLTSSQSLPQISEPDPKECTDRLCRLPSKCRSGYILGSPRRHTSSSSAVKPMSLTQSSAAGDLQTLNNLTLVRNNHKRSNSESGASLASPHQTKKEAKKAKEKKEKEEKKLPSNFMYLGTWCTRPNCDRLMTQVKSGDILEFNITLHHHWGIAIIPKNKPPSLDTVDLVHTIPDKDGRQRALKQPLREYWHEGVTARINNSRDKEKHPRTAGEVTAAAQKLTLQPYRFWLNSEQMSISCRYGDSLQERQLSDAARM